jgi:dihydroflavonol-4-reductase
MNQLLELGTDQKPAAAAAGFWRGRQVCVTGGGGFLGYHLVEQLLALQARVSVLTLPPRKPHPVTCHPHVRCELGDVRDQALVRRTLAGCDVVFHTAAMVAFSGRAQKEIHSVSLEGTKNVLAAAPRGTRIVHTSSIVAVGGTPTGLPVTEDSCFSPELLAIPYVRAKRAAEDLALEAAGRHDVVVTNPCYLAGPQDYCMSDMGRFCLRYWKGRMLLAMPGGINVVDVRDVARGHLLAAEHGIPGQRYILGGTDCSFPELLGLLAQVGGLRPRWLPRVPRLLVRPLARVATSLAWLRGRNAYPSMQHAQLSRYCWFARSDRAARELGYQSRPLICSLADTYRWFASRKKLRLRRLNAWWARPAAELPSAA